MKAFILMTGGVYLLLLYFLQVFGQQSGLPDHYPKYLRTGSYAKNFQGTNQQNYGVKTSGVKTSHVKTSGTKTSYRKTGSSNYMTQDLRDTRNIGSYGSYQQPHQLSYPQPYQQGNQQQSAGCTSTPRPPMNSHIRCSSNSCNATCLAGYQFPDGQNRITLGCRDGTWTVQKPNWMGVFVGETTDVIPVACEPVCEPACENNGICYEPNRCNCPENYSGIRCENSRKPCLNYPTLPMNARRTCSTTQCTVTCLKGHSFPDGSAIATLKCIDGNWVPAKENLRLHCEPSCNPPCQNGGNCLSLNVCQCPQDFRGAQCQYSTSACNVKLLGFNGGYNCSGDAETFKCSVNCPTGIEFEFAPSEFYTCKYSTGLFEPQPVPQCIYNTNFEVLPLESNFSSFSQHKSMYTNLGSENALRTVEMHLPTAGNCYHWAGTHFKTFDGATFSAISSCAHTLVRDAVDNSFSIVIGNNEQGKVIYIYIQDKEYTLTTVEPEVPALFGPGGKRLPLPGQVPGLRGSLEAHYVIITIDNPGITIKWDTKNFLDVHVGESLWNRTEGLCGRLDGDKSNDLLGKDGQKKRTISALVDSWKLNILGETCTKPIRDTFYCSTVSKTLASRAHAFCTQLLADKRFAPCHNLNIDTAEFLKACQWDFCSCAQQNDPSVCACESVHVFVEECKRKNTNDELVIRWRDESTCPVKCSGGRIYTPCSTTSVQATCGAPHEDNDDSDNSKKCFEGCFCPTGTVLYAGQCITVDNCPCRLRGREFSPGAQVPKECNTCTCENGQWKCTELQCGARCSAVGDPHYKTFDGKTYDFMGQCKYYLVKGNNFSIEADNVACAGSISQNMNFPVNLASGLPSCTRSITIKTPSGHVIKLKQNQEVLVDGQDILRLPYNIGDDSSDVIRAASSLFLVVELENGIEVWWDGVTRVYIDAPASFRDQTQGLCGTFNSNQKDDFLTPEGDVENDVIAFANKWKVDERCEDIKQNQHSKDHPCEVNIQNKAKAEKYCGVIQSKLFNKCHWLVDPQKYYEDCLYDMCSCEGRIADCLCSTLAAYGTSCAAVDAGVNWRAEVPECGIVCTDGQTYQFCGDACTRSCEDIASRTNCKKQCVEGCNCPEGQTLNEHDDCVPITECGCRNNGVKYPAGYQELRDSALAPETCACMNGNWLCRLASQTEIKSLPKQSDRNVCSPAKNQEFTTCEPAVPVTCRNMHDLSSFSTAVCRPGCKCKAGYVLSPGASGMCVRPSECPCHHGGQSYTENATIQNDCNNCTCTNGVWVCTKETCAAECTSWGDSHFTTFDSKDFDYQGQCDYVLAKGSLGKHDHFEITVQNVPCGSLGVSCSKSVTIQVSGETLTLSREKPIPAGHKLLRRMSMRQTDLYVIVEVADLGLSIFWDKGTRVVIRASPRWQGRTKGLCGNYNNNQNDDFQTPSGGFSEISPVVFGDSWRVSQTCPPGSEVVDTCALRPERRAWAVKKCGILKSDVFASCHAQVPVDKFLERCVFDSCACDRGGDCECLCTAIAAYAHECNRQGIHNIKWRTQQLCPIQCDETCTTYTPCLSTCPPETCDNVVSHSRLAHLCESETCIEGCAPRPCPPGQIYLNATTADCVPRATCKPICLQLDSKVYSEGDLIEEDDCQKCYCSNNRKICTGKPCTTNITTTAPPLPNDSIVACKSGWTEWINQDRAKSGKEKKLGKKYDVEPVPERILLQQNAPVAGVGVCGQNKMIDIQCRTVTGGIDPKALSLDIECSLERGLICKSDKKNGELCPDFEIRVLCECEPPEIPAVEEKPCNSSQPHQQHEDDCHLFYHCVPGVSGSTLVEKSCGPDMFYNPTTQICDFPDSVIQVRPECKNLPADTKNKIKPKKIKKKKGKHGEDVEIVSVEPECPEGYHWSECAVECTRVCAWYEGVLRSRSRCLLGEACEEGCVKDDRPTTCPPGWLWRDNSTCVEIEDCVCRADDGAPVKPGTVHQTGCAICQCIDNHYTCDYTSCVTSDLNSGAGAAGPAVEAKGNLVPFVIPATETPPPECPKAQLTELLGPAADQPVSDAAFSASGVQDGAHQPWYARIGNELGAWAPQNHNQDQYIQVDLGRVEPIYGLILLGDPSYDNYVTSFHVLYGTDNNFRYAVTKSGMPQLFRGSVDHRTPVKVILDTPIEAKVVRINPKTWHNDISVKFELIGCGELHTTTEQPVATTIQHDFEELTTLPSEEMMCDEPMGLNNEQIPADQITVSSEKYPGEKYYGLRLNSSQIWQPLTNSPNEYVRFDFGGPRQLTGLETRGGRNGWVSAYKLSYSSDDNTWNPVLDEYGDEEIFPGNFDQDTVFKNKFKKPIRAQFLKVLPKKWMNNIQMAAEPHGCFEPYPTQEATVLPEIENPVIKCSTCPHTTPAKVEDSTDCPCSHPLYHNGTSCVARASCPCLSPSTETLYPVGSVYDVVSDCSTCLCALGGVPQCSKIRCDPCEGGLRSTFSKTCGCVCIPCPVGEVLCPSGNVCIKKEMWCDGIVDCPDDEVNCPAIVSTIEPFLTTKQATKLQCPPVVCPPGFKITLKQPSPREEDLQKNLSPMFHMYGGRKTKMPLSAKQITAKYYGTKSSRKTLPRKPLKSTHSVMKNVNKQVCVEFICEPPDNIVEKCPEPACPPGYSIIYTETEVDKVETLDEQLCKPYECHPPPVRDDVCNVTGASFNTFDGTEFKYDICNHVLARDLHSDDWDVILVKNCTEICTRDLVIRHGSQLVKMFSDLSMEYNGYRYTAEQTAQIGAKNLAFVVSRMGNTLLFVSNHYGFWIMWDKLSNVKLGVTEKLVGQVDGLCGFYDKNKRNDKRKPDGRQAKTTVAFGDSWLVLEDNQNKPEICETPRACPLHVQNVAYKMCQAVKERILAPCLHALDDIDGWVSRCLETTCACLEQAKNTNQTNAEDKCRCNVLEAFVVECTTVRPSVELEDWRMVLECPAECAAPLVHHDCYRRRCEPSCTNLAEADSCPTLPNLCFPGCYCPAGLVRKKGKCVAPKECRDCECNVLPHLEYVTYDGANHTANTNCTYIMSRDIQKDGQRDFEVYVTNGPCSLNPGKMCTEVITLLVNEHRIEVRRGKTYQDDHQVTIDDTQIELPFENTWLEVLRLPARHVNILVPKLQVELRTYFPTLGASLRVPSHSYSQKMEGICGDCNRNPDNDIEVNEDDFIASWQVNKNDTAVCIEEVVKDCVVDDDDPCLVLLDADRFGQCHILIDPKVFLSTCRHDTCGGRKEAACSSLETYAMACRAQGLCIDYHTKLCPAQQCPPDAEYKLCGPPCPATCDTPKGCSRGLPKEGCFCPPGLVLKNNTECVEERVCFACDEQGLHYPGDSWTQDACTKCECDLVTRTTRCETQSCPTVEKLCDDGYQAVKIKKSDTECCDKFACVPANITKPECKERDEPKAMLCGEDQVRKLEKRPDGCLDFVCQCIPVSECPDLTVMNQEPLPVGFERVKNDSGCCPRLTQVCKTENCPRPPSCPKHHQPVKESVADGQCCPEYKCVPPADKCLFTTSYIASTSGGERPLTPLEQDTVLLEENQTLADGPCRTCRCQRLSSSTLSTTCSVTECPIIEEMAQAKEYVLEAIGTRGVCCPTIKKKACKHNNEIYKPGSKWPLDPIKTPCVILECLQGSDDDDDINNDEVSLTRHEVSCDVNCKPGHDYEPSAAASGECCGQCVQVSCVVDGQVQPVDKEWKSKDLCTEYKCVNENGTIFVQKKDISCPKPTEDMLKEFVYTYEPIDGECCGRHVPVACLVDGQQHHVGDTWPDPGNDPCVTVTCLHSGAGGSELTQQRTVESCNTECRPGWRYSPSGAPDICCGECTQVSCISNGTLYLPGDTWMSDDGCTTFECTKQPDGSLTTSVNQETCPDLTECPVENQWRDGCCTKCNITTGAMKKTSCEPVALADDDTLGLVVQVHGIHGRCINIEPMANFTECRGLCPSATVFNSKTSMHESSCLCCQATEYTALSVELLCGDGYRFQKQVAVPSECDCNMCGGERKQHTKS